MNIDSHVHLWHYNDREYLWMQEGMDVLRRDYLPDELKPLLDSVGFDGVVVIEARQMLAENDYILNLAKTNPSIMAYVGWVDLCSDEAANQLEPYQDQPLFRGVRHVLIDEPDDDFILREDFQRGLALLGNFGMTYDLLVRWDQLPQTIEIARRFPEQPFVLDHIANPLIKEGMMSPWKENLQTLATCPNVVCKLSGFAEFTHWHQWTPAEFDPYLDIVTEAFGHDRLMIGSNWPVCTLSGDYQPVMNIVINYLRQFSPEVQSQIFGGNCARFYGISS
jgi:L-fuconolactonase